MRKKIIILGAGESGTGAAILAAEKGYDVFVSDKGKISDKYKKMLAGHNIKWEENKHTEEIIFSAEKIIKSPGIPENIDLIKNIRKANIPVVSEIEFAGEYTDAKKICITGSNGKTTTTTLLYYILQKAGLNVAMAGNIGKSFALQVAKNHCDYYVIELSSFQLDDTINFKPDIAVLLNITPDHIDRYDNNLQNYINSKFRIIKNLTPNDHYIYCSDDKTIEKENKKKTINANTYPFGLKHEGNNVAYTTDNNIHININNDNPLIMGINNLSVQGKHNIYNTMAAGIAAKVLEIRNETVRESMSDFQGVEHRLESFLRVRGIEFINDSKATNVNSTWYALESMRKPVVWIAGGVDKGNDYSELKSLVKEKVKAIICLGKDNKKIIESFKGLVSEVVEAKSMDEAVCKSYYLANKDEVVLLSPACASFDLFNNYEDRGRQFKACVRNL